MFLRFSKHRIRFFSEITCSLRRDSSHILKKINSPTYTQTRILSMSSTSSFWTQIWTTIGSKLHNITTDTTAVFEKEKTSYALVHITAITTMNPTIAINKNRTPKYDTTKVNITGKIGERRT